MCKKDEKTVMEIIWHFCLDRWRETIVRIMQRMLYSPVIYDVFEAGAVFISLICTWTEVPLCCESKRKEWDVRSHNLFFFLFSFFGLKMAAECAARPTVSESTYQRYWKLSARTLVSLSRLAHSHKPSKCCPTTGAPPIHHEASPWFFFFFFKQGKWKSMKFRIIGKNKVSCLCGVVSSSWSETVMEAPPILWLVQLMAWITLASMERCRDGVIYLFIYFLGQARC